MILEACVETFEQAVLAEKKGADRIELCADLNAGGLTPDFQLVLKTSSFLNIPVMVMIRPRAGNFVYSDEEIRLMADQIHKAKEARAAGIVFGLLTPENRVDVENTKRLAKASVPLPVTFHKAIDELDDPVEGIKALRHMVGIRRVLTSGGKSTAVEGNHKIREMMEEAGEDLTIIVAGRVTSDNVLKIRELTGGLEFHGKKIVGDLTYYQKTEI